MKKKKIYLKNKDLYLEIIKSKEADELSPTALKMLMLLTDRVSNKFRYNNPDDKYDCISTAYLDLLKYWRSFDPEKSKNAFAYYTEIIKKAFAKAWGKLHPKKYAGTFSLDGSGKDLYSI
jgi:DNA-directed RNA polymerase specialized sigma subunit